MNERIRELAEQAGFNHMGIGLIIGIEEYHQKFALLIVKECTNFLKDTMDDHFAAEQLEEHFGVEE
jgi:hypothetical protein